MISQRPERHFIRMDRIRKLAAGRTEGGTHIYVLCLFIMMFLLVLFRAMFDNQRLNITKDTVDDALMTSLVSSCVYNKSELSSSGACVIFQQVTPFIGELTDVSIGGRPILDPDPVDVFALPELGFPDTDTYLDNSWKKFEANIKKNLKLDDAMNATISGIDGVVTIAEFCVYNKFYNLDADRNQTDFKFVKYSYNPATGAWSSYQYAPNTYPSTYNSLTKSSYEIRESSVSAKLDFTVVAGTATGFAQTHAGKTQNDYNVPVSYQRIVDIKTVTSP